jgi:hypothetical protein
VASDNGTSREERRRVPGSFGYLFCWQCKARFVVAGRMGPHDSPATASVVCPECRAEALTTLPRDVTRPFRVLTVREPMRRED